MSEKIRLRSYFSKLLFKYIYVYVYMILMVYMYIYINTHTHIYIWDCCCSVTKSCLTLCDPMNCSQTGSSVHGVFPGKITGMSWHFLLQGILPIWGSNPCLLHWQEDSLSLSHLGSPYKRLQIFKTECYLWEREIKGQME